MDSNSPVSPETLQSDLALELEQLKHELQIAEGKIMQLELALLQSRDFAIGAAAEAGEAPAYRARYVESERKLGDANEHIKSHLAHIARLEQALADLLKFEKINKDLRTQVETLHNSATWRIGRKVMLPIRIIKRIVK
jgi:predicted  nucleic acid-binding Zn-ribbon protein